MLQLKNVSKFYYPKKGEPVQALKDINLKLPDKGMIFILGKSGSGKSTLLNLIGGLDKYDEGEIIIKDKSITDFKKNDYDSYRNTMIGFVFQEYNILDEFTVAQNIILALQLQGIKATNDLLNKILEDVDLVGFGNRNPNELSGGQKQRVAISRALVKNPEIIMADEPTGALDSETGKQIFETLQNLSKSRLVIVVSHDREYAEQYGDRIIEFKDGEIISDVSKEINGTSKTQSISIINDTLEVTKGYEMTQQDLKLINDYLKGNKLAIKNINNNNGVGTTFTNTNQDSIVINNDKYVPIKSKLPLKVSMKMGASSLKHKKIRLFFSILLASIAFAMFGLADTMSSYKKEKSFKQSYYDSEISQSSLLKYSNLKNEYGYIDRNRKKYSQKEIDDLISKYPELNLMPIFSATDSTFNNYDGTRLELSNNLDTNSYQNFSYMSGFAEIKSETMNTFKMSFLGSKSRLPASVDEIVVTDFVYKLFNKFDHKKYDKIIGDEVTTKINNYDDLIGKQIITGQYNDIEFTIVGIVNTGFNFDRYEQAMFADRNDNTISNYLLQSELVSLLSGSNHALGFVMPGYIKNQIDNPILKGYGDLSGLDIYVNELNNIDSISIDDEINYFNNVDKNNLNENDIIIKINRGSHYINQIYYGWDELVHDYLNTLTLDEIRTLIINIDEKDNNDESYRDLTDEGIISSIESLKYEIDYRYYSSFNHTQLITAPNGFKSRESFTTELFNIFVSKDPEQFKFKFSFYENDEYKEIKEDMTVVGFIINDEENTYSNDIYVTSEFLNTHKSKNIYVYDSLIGTSFIGHDKTFDILIKDHFKENGDSNRIANEITVIFDQLSSTIESLSKVFLYVGIGFVVFASLLLLNFITTSVSYKKQEIGILRAIGARGKDVTKIFFNEALIIALINFVIASIITTVSIIFINNFLRNDYDILMTVLSIGIRQIILILVISITVAFLSSSIPVYNIARKRPIDAIRDK